MKKLLNKESLNAQEAAQLFANLATFSLEKQAAILALLSSKNESVTEISIARQHFSQYSTVIKHDLDILDIVGTGGDGLNTFNISTAASLIVASCGVNVAKHGGKSATSNTGSQDVISSLGITTPSSATQALEHLKKQSFVYLYAPLFNLELKKYAKLRSKIGLPTIFNILGPLLNPMRPQKCVIGVFRRDLVTKVAENLKIQGVKRALIIHSNDGLDEISISANTYALEINNNKTTEYYISPQDFSIPTADISSIKGGNSQENAHLIEDIFAAKITGAKLNVILLNAAAGLYIANKSNSLQDGFVRAQQAIKSGTALALLNKLRSQACK